MPYTHSILPPDPRALPEFMVVHGMDQTLFRAANDMGSTGSTDFTVVEGEPVRCLLADTGTSTAYRLDPTGSTCGALVGMQTDKPKGLSWDRFDSQHSSAYGTPSAHATGKVTTLSGHFVARVKAASWFVTAAAEITNTSDYPVGINSTAAAAIIAAPYSIGDKVAMIRTRSGRGKLIAIPSDYTVWFTAGGATKAEIAALRLTPVGTIIKKYTTNSVVYVEIAFNL